MMIRIKKYPIDIVLLFLSVLGTLLISKTYYFGVANRRTYQYVYYSIIIISFLACSKRMIDIRSMLRWIIPMETIIIICTFFHYENMNSSEINLVLGVLLFILFSALTAVIISPSTFATYYIRLMSIMCIISLFCCFLANLYPEIVRKIFLPDYNWSVPVGYSMFYTWGWNGTIFSRNSGMFWEAGGYQGFVFLALLCILFNVDCGSIKKRRALVVLFTITIITSQSTTGYILLIIAFIFLWEQIENNVGIQNKHFRYIITVALTVAVLAFVIGSGNIASKLTNTTGNSASIRLNDFKGGMILSIRGGILGLGETPYKDMLKRLFHVGINDSVGLFALAYTYGLAFGMMYIVFAFKGMLGFYSPKSLKDNVILIVIFTILHMTEGLWWLPVYLVIPFLGIIHNYVHPEDDNTQMG